MMRRLTIVATLLLAARLLVSFIMPAWTTLSTDFPNYYTASWALAHAEDMEALYDPVAFNEIAARAGLKNIAVVYYFPPVSALVTLPVTSFSPLNALRIWILVNLLALAVLVRLVSKHSGLDLLRTTFLALLAGDALGNNFLYGQIYIPVAVFLVLGFVWAESRPAASGFALALATALKLFPAVFLLYLICRRRWKALAWTGVWIALLAGVSVFAVGWEAHRVFVVEALPRMMRGEIQDPYNVGWNQLQSWLRRSFVPEPALNPNSLFDAPGVFFFLKTALNLLILFFSAMTLRDGRMKPLLAFNVLFLAVSLISPGQASYHYVLLIPGIAMLASDARSRVWAMVCLGLACWSLPASLVFVRSWVLVGLWIWMVWQIRPRIPWPAFPAIVVLAAVASYWEMQRWHADVADGAVLAAPEQHGYIEVEPRFNSGGVEFKSMIARGWSTRTIQRPPDPEVSDQRWTVYVTFERGNWDVGLRNRRSGETRILTSSLANDVMPVLSPDGREVFFASDRRRGYRFTAVYRMPVPR
jgi:hypothetical protein